MNPILPIEQLNLLALAISALMAWSVWQSSRRCGGKVRWTLLALRLAAVGGLYVIALNPGRWKVLSNEETSEWAVLVDSSASMATRDAGDRTRWARAAAIAEQLGADRDHEFKFFRFDADLRAVDAPKQLAKEDCNGSQTDIVGALTRLVELERSSHKRLAGVILLTDGRQIPPRPSAEVAMDLRATHSPVYPLVLGEAVKKVDLAVSTRRQQYIAFTGQPFTVSARLKSYGLQNIRPKVSLLDAAGTVVAEKTVTIGSQTEMEVPFEIKPRAAGYSVYQVRVDPWAGETVAGNNSAEFAVYALQDKMRVLLVEGMPHWDSKFMAQLLQRQDNVSLSLIYRLTQERFFSQVATNLVTTNRTLKTFPDTAEALGDFDLIVAGKGFEYFLNRDAVGALKEFLRDRGGGLIFTRGKPYSGEQPELEALEPITWGPEWSQNFVWQPTVVGEESGLFSDGLPGQKDLVWTKLPELSHAWQAMRPKVFAQVLAEGVSQVAGRTNRLPVVVSQRFGKGQVVVVNSDDLWQWDFFPKFEGASEIYRDFWLQLINWSMAYADFLPGHDWSMHLSDHVAEAGQSVRIDLANRHTRGEKTEGKPVVRIWRGEQLATELQPGPLAGKPDEYEGIFSLAQPGLYRIEAKIGSSPKPLVYETLAVQPLPAEKDDVSPDRESLQSLAAATEGKVVSEADLPGLFRPAPVTAESLALDNAVWLSAWDHGWCLLLVAALFCTEWVVRRRHGLT